MTEEKTTEEKYEILELTDEQMAKIPKYDALWNEIAISTDTNVEEANKAMDKVYECAGYPPTPNKHWADNPYEAILLAHRLLFGEDKPYTADSLKNLLDCCCYGNQDKNYLMFHTYFYFEANQQQCSKIIGLAEYAKHGGWFIPFPEFVVMSYKPLEIHMKGNVLHKDLAPAIKFRGDYEIFALNGVEMSKELVMTPAQELDVQLVLKEKNAEIRREIVRKIGVERLLTELKADVIDEMDSYQLLGLTLDDGRVRPYLKMTNPSTGTFHVEGVAPEIKTVVEALAWRNQETMYIKPEILT